MQFGLGTIVFLIFLVLKLANVGDVANWSWWWVTSPLWIAGILWVIVVVIASIRVSRAERRMREWRRSRRFY